jgi:hypothetical protein
MVRVGLTIALIAACRLANAQQAQDDETPGAHKKVVPPPPPAPAAQPAPKAEEPPAEPPQKGKKGKKGKKKKGEDATPVVAPTPPPEPPPVTPAAPAAAATPEPAPAPQAAEVAPAAAPRAAEMAVVRAEGEPSWSLGARLRYITVPSFLEFTQVNHPLNSASFALEGVRRKGDADIVFALDFSFMSPEDGNWLGNGKNPGTDTEYLQFKGLNVIGLEATWVWHVIFNKTAQLEWGIGGGLGIVTGKLMRIVNTSAGCASNPSDPTVCYPVVCGGGPCTDAQLAMHQAPSSCHDKSCAGGNQFEDGNVPPVIPIIHILVGGVFQVSDKIRLRVEGGFHDAFFLGVASEYSL